jgi:hypothetical protein
MVPPVLYKYRSVENWKFFKEIFTKRRLYAAAFRTLNDPMEGLLYEHDKDVSLKYRKAIRNASGRLNICSLCDSHNNTLLWSYYSDGHKGVAFGVKVLASDSPRVDEPIEVRYDMTVTIDPKAERTRSPSDVAKSVLTQKLTFWGHEKEYRVFTTQHYVPVEISEVVLGCNVTRETAKEVRALTARHLPGTTVRLLRRSDLQWPGFQ